jgi:hypothetical protein
LLVVKAHLLEVKEHQKMSTLFPTFLSIWQRAKQLLSTDTRDIWQALEIPEEVAGQGFYDGCIYHPSI